MGTVPAMKRGEHKYSGSLNGLTMLAKGKGTEYDTLEDAESE